MVHSLLLNSVETAALRKVCALNWRYAVTLLMQSSNAHSHCRSFASRLRHMMQGTCQLRFAQSTHVRIMKRLFRTNYEILAHVMSKDLIIISIYQLNTYVRL